MLLGLGPLNYNWLPYRMSLGYSETDRVVMEVVLCISTMKDVWIIAIRSSRFASSSMEHLVPQLGPVDLAVGLRLFLVATPFPLLPSITDL